ncbi:hypothetical protein D3C75_1077260 [compost metagenome]
MFDNMLRETLMIMKDRVGNVKEVYNLQANGNRGFDCGIIGVDGRLSITTILAGGYNIQKLHYRTLAYKY